MSVTANGDRMKTVALSFSHTEVAHGSLLQRDFLEKACTFALLGALAGDAYPYLAGIVVFIEPHHLPFFLVKGIITGYCARVRRNLQIDGRYGEPFMVVVVGSPLGAHRDDTVVSALVLFKSELLPQRVVGIHEKVGRVVRPLRGESRRHFGRERERLAVVHFREQDRQGGVAQLSAVGVAKEVEFLRTTEFYCTSVFHGDASVCPVECTRESDAIHADIAGSYFGGNCRRVSRDLFHHVFSLILLLAALRSQSGSDKCREDKCFSHKWYDYIGVVLNAF